MNALEFVWENKKKTEVHSGIPKEMTNFEEFRWNIFKKYKPLISENCDDFRFIRIHT